jgi:hypothetical protein
VSMTERSSAADRHANQCKWFYYNVKTTSNLRCNSEGVNAVELLSSLAAVRVARCAPAGGNIHRGAGDRAPFLAGRGQGAVQVLEQTVGTSAP